MNKPVTENEKLARIKINAFGYMRADWYNKLIEVYGSAEEILKSQPHDIAQNGGVTPGTAQKFLEEAHKTDPEKEMSDTQKLGGKILVQGDGEYPESLKNIPQPPIVLYVRGNIKDEQIKVAIVGTRKPSGYGRRMTAKLARDIAGCKITIVSGLARGIDSIAHLSALDVSGTTWAVLGTGLGKYYPAENKKLTETIINKGGAIITEIPFHRGPMAFHFPRRNRIIAGLGLLTVVMEGTEKSGALITAKFALEQGKDVLAVPGSVDAENSVGPNQLIRDGASIVLSSLDIIEHIPLQYRFSVDTDRVNKNKNLPDEKSLGTLSDDEKNVLNKIASDDLSLDDIASGLNWSVPKTSQILFELESKSVLTRFSGKYSRKI